MVTNTKAKHRLRISTGISLKTKINTQKMNLYWHDSEVRFDVNPSLLQMASGESLLVKQERVEDSKANAGEYGCMVFTNLRLFWYSSKNAKLNLTIGYNTLSSITTKKGLTKYGSGDSLYILSKTFAGKYEFLFTPSERALVMFNALLEIHRSYVSSRLFRELRLRHHIIHSGQLQVLPLENICNRLEGVWNLASNQGNLGCFVITTVRIVWFASMNEHFNISLPYLHITEIDARDSKFGQVLVVETSDYSGGYLLGFRIDPPTRMKEILLELKSLHSTQTRNPEFGVRWKGFQQPIEVSEESQPSPSAKEDLLQQFISYNLERAVVENGVHQIVQDRATGLAMEQLPPNVDRKQLWQMNLSII